MHSDQTIVLLNYLLDNCKAQADALVVNVCSAMQFAESREQFCDVVFMDTSPSVLDVANEDASSHVVRHFDLNLAFRSELVRVLDQVEKYLLQACLISVQCWNLSLERFSVFMQRLIRYTAYRLVWRTPKLFKTDLRA